MTTLVAMIGLFPAAVSTGIGSQTQKPLAVVVIGGAFLVAVVARAVQPPLLLLAHTWLENRQRRGVRHWTLHGTTAHLSVAGGAGLMVITTSPGRAFDESLVDAARSLHVGEVAVAATACAALLFVWLERRGRSRWKQVPSGTVETSRQPYRATRVVAEYLERAPRRVRFAAFSSLAFVMLFGPLNLEALIEYPFDGIAIPLIPGLALVLLDAWCAYMLLVRSPLASAAARSGAVGSIMANVGLLILAAAHFVTVELQRRDGIEHACSSSVDLRRHRLRRGVARPGAAHHRGAERPPHGARLALALSAASSQGIPPSRNGTGCRLVHLAGLLARLLRARRCRRVWYRSPAFARSAATPVPRSNMMARL